MKTAIKTSSEGRIILRQNTVYYLSYLIVSILLIGVIAISDGIYIPHIILLLLSLIGLTFRDDWSFNTKTGMICATFGYCFINKKKYYRMSDLSQLKIEGFTKGFMGKVPSEIKEKRMVKRMRQISLVITLMDDDEAVISTAPLREHFRLEQTGLKLADQLAIDFVDTTSTN